MRPGAFHVGVEQDSRVADPELRRMLAGRLAGDRGGGADGPQRLIWKRGSSDRREGLQPLAYGAYATWLKNVAERCHLKARFSR